MMRSLLVLVLLAAVCTSLGKALATPGLRGGKAASGMGAGVWDWWGFGAEREGTV